MRASPGLAASTRGHPFWAPTAPASPLSGRGPQGPAGGAQVWRATPGGVASWTNSTGACPVTTWLVTGRLPPSGPGQVRGVATEPQTSQFDNPQPTGDPAAIIPVQRIRGPIFLDCGGSDSVWSSCPYADAIMSRLDQARDPYPHLLYAYPDAGHGVGDIVPYEPDQLGPAAADLLGSSPNANHNADAQIWPHLLAFLAGSGGAY